MRAKHPFSPNSSSNCERNIVLWRRRIVNTDTLRSRITIAVVVTVFVVAVAAASDWLAGRPLLSEPLVVVAVAVGFVFAAVGPPLRTVVRRRS